MYSIYIVQFIKNKLNKTMSNNFSSFTVQGKSKSIQLVGQLIFSQNRKTTPD